MFSASAEFLSLSGAARRPALPNMHGLWKFRSTLDAHRAMGHTWYGGEISVGEQPDRGSPKKFKAQNGTDFRKAQDEIDFQNLGHGFGFREPSKRAARVLENVPGGYER